MQLMFAISALDLKVIEEHYSSIFNGLDALEMSNAKFIGKTSISTT